MDAILFFIFCQQNVLFSVYSSIHVYSFIPCFTLVKLFSAHSSGEIGLTFCIYRKESSMYVFSSTTCYSLVDLSYAQPEITFQHLIFYSSYLKSILSPQTATIIFSRWPPLLNNRSFFLLDQPSDEDEESHHASSILCLSADFFFYDCPFLMLFFLWQFPLSCAWQCPLFCSLSGLYSFTHVPL